MTNWKMVAEDLRKALRQHRLTCCLCKRGDLDVVLVSDRCREGGMLLSEIVIADIQAEVQAVKRMHGCAS